MDFFNKNHNYNNMRIGEKEEVPNPLEDDTDKRTLFVANLSEKITEEILYELFLQAGPISSLHIPKEKESKRLKTFGFITYAHRVTIPYALQLFEGIKLFNRNLVIRLKNSANQNDSQSRVNNMSVCSTSSNNNNDNNYRMFDTGWDFNNTLALSANSMMLNNSLLCGMNNNLINQQPSLNQVNLMLLENTKQHLELLQRIGNNNPLQKNDPPPERRDQFPYRNDRHQERHLNNKPYNRSNDRRNNYNRRNDRDSNQRNRNRR